MHQSHFHLIKTYPDLQPPGRGIGENTQDILLTKLRELDWDLKSDLVQDYWNKFETQLVGVTDEIVPYKLFEFKTVVEPIPAMIKHKQMKEGGS